MPHHSADLRRWVTEKLWQEYFEDVEHIEHGGPGLVDYVETDGAGSAWTSR